MKLKFKIIDRKYSSGYPVRIYINLNSNRIEMNTGVFIQDPKNFDSLTLVHDDEPNHKVKNIKLRHIQSEMEMFTLTEKNPTAIKEKIEILVNGEARKKKVKDFTDFIMDFAATKENPGTRGLYELTARKVADFDAKADFEKIDAAWLKEFERHNIRRGMSVNGIAIHLRNIRTVFNWCIDNEYTDKYLQEIQGEERESANQELDGGTNRRTTRLCGRTVAGDLPGFFHAVLLSVRHKPGRFVALEDG